MTFPNSGDERYFYKETNKILNQKRKKENENEDKRSHSKFTYDNLKRKSKINYYKLFLNEDNNSNI